MRNKRFSGAVTFKAEGEGEPGSFRAVFSTLNVIDADNDVTVPGAFADGEAVRISYWGHRWQDLPVGKGVIHADEESAWVDGQFFLQTQAGRETYETVKALGPLQEWSYGYDVLEASPGQYEGKAVQFLRRLKVDEVSPVLRGAGVDTRTVDIKAVDGKEDYPWDECIADQMERYGDEETARRVCGMIRQRYGHSSGTRAERLGQILPEVERIFGVEPVTEVGPRGDSGGKSGAETEAETREGKVRGKASTLAITLEADLIELEALGGLT